MLKATAALFPPEAEVLLFSSTADQSNISSSVSIPLHCVSCTDASLGHMCAQTAEIKKNKITRAAHA